MSASNSHPWAVVATRVSLTAALVALAACADLARATGGGPRPIHFSDCQVGAAADCVPGSNTNAGTLAAPKRDLAGVRLNDVPAGSTLLFARGGAWNVATLMRNLNVSSAAPLTFADYGSGPLPLFNTPANTAFAFAVYGDTVQDGGYVFRNLKIDGRGTGQWGFFVHGNTRDVVFDGVEITGFDIGIHAQQSANAPNERLTIRNSVIRGNRQHGFLGDANGLLIENSRFEDNNPSGGGREHGIYIGGKSTGFTVRNNVLRRNSAPNGVCDGGNLTIHGQHENALIEGNVIEQASATPGCYGISLTAAYTTAEWFRNAVIRNNTVINVGGCAVCVSSAPGVLIEGNKLYNIQPTFQVGVQIPGIVPGPGDVADGAAIIRNNLICQSAPAPGSEAVRAPSAATNTGNVYRTGAAATTEACAR